MALKVNAAAGFPQNMPVVLLQMTALLSGSRFFCLCRVILFYFCTVYVRKKKVTRADLFSFIN